MNNKILIALEGADCAGKSSIIEKLKIVLPIIYPNKKFLFTREPGNLLSENNKSEEIREKLLTNKALSVKEQAELFAESRKYHTQEIVNKINEGYIIITDRYLLSSLVYQRTDVEIDDLFEMNKESCDLLNNNKIKLENIVFKISKETYDKRMENREEDKDAMEDVALEQVYQRIADFNSMYNGEELKNIDNNRALTIDANGDDYSRIFIDTLYRIDKILND